MPECLKRILNDTVKAQLKSAAVVVKSMSITGPAVKLHCGASPLAPNLRDFAKPCSIMLYCCSAK